MKKIRIAAIILAGLCVMTMLATAEGVVRGRGVRQNAMGGITARSGSAFADPTAEQAYVADRW